MKIRHVGTRDQSVVLFIHGMVFDSRFFDPLVSALGDRDCALVDLQGHGASAGELVIPFDQIIAEIESDPSLVRASRVSIVGHSLGTYLAFGLALRHKLRIDRLALLGPLAGYDAAVCDGYRALATGLESGGADLVAVGLEAFFSAPSLERVPGLKMRATRLFREADVGVAVSELKLLADHTRDLRGEVARLKMPVLLRVGALDQSTPVAWAESLAKSLPDTRLEVVPDAGHALAMEDLEGTGASLKRFLS